MKRVATFTDTYFPTVNGVTYTITTWRDRWAERGGRMDVIYPDNDEYDPDAGEHPVQSLPFPFYDDFRLGLPRIPDSIRDADLVHIHGPFLLGIAGLRFAHKEDIPVVASYHTPTEKYTHYLATRRPFSTALKYLSKQYERWFFQRVDCILTPSEATKRYLLDTIGVDSTVKVVPNGVNVRQFRPVDSSDFLTRHGIETDRPIIGYTGRHGYEKNLSEIIEAARELDVTVIFGGDGPARDDLEASADEYGIDAHFLGYLNREEMPEFYSALDVFVFPSPAETQGLVALDAYACGTPVVGVDVAGLSNTIKHGVTGYHYEIGEIEQCRDAIRCALSNNNELRKACLDRRDEISAERSVERLADIYEVVSQSRTNTDQDAQGNLNG